MTDVVEHVDILHAGEIETPCVLREEESQRGGHGSMLRHTVGGQALQVVGLVPGHNLEKTGIFGAETEEDLQHVEGVGRQLMIDGRAFDPHLGAIAECGLGQFESCKRGGYGGNGKRGLGAIGVIDGLNVLRPELVGLLPALYCLAAFMKSEYVWHIKCCISS